MTSKLPPIIQAFSGAIGSATANAIVYPLDLVATRLQTTSSKRFRGFRGVPLALQHALTAEGWQGLYDGLDTDTAATILSNFLYFYFYSFLRGILVRRKARVAPPKNMSPTLLLSITEELGIGFISGVASRAISTPLSVITVRLQTQFQDDDDVETDANEGQKTVKHKEHNQISSSMGMHKLVKDIYKEEGLQGFWSGFTTAIPLSLNPAITLFLFQLFRRFNTRSSSTTLATPKPSSAFLGAAISNTIATVLLYPLILAKTRLQIYKKQAGGDTRVNLLTVWRDAVRKDGIQGVYRGLEAQILKGFVSEGVKMMVKQRVELLVVALYVRRWFHRKA